MAFYHPEVMNGDTVLSKDESFHCIKVLRYQEGDDIEIFDGNGGIYQAKIIEGNPSKCQFKIISATHAEPDPYHLHLAIAPTKNTDRMEWMIEKCVEVGLHEISFLLCTNSERSRLRTDRLEKKMIAAMKQSRHPYATTIHERMMDFNEFLSKLPEDSVRHICHVPVAQTATHLKDTVKNKKYVVLVGPEGDFTKNEIKASLSSEFMPTSLGNSRLRTETAGLIACHTLALIHF
jgi:16S rRNA (uracil1498-N3)-methyltransferase